MTNDAQPLRAADSRRARAPLIVIAAVLLCALLALPAAAAAPVPSVYLEELTWTELRDALAAGELAVGTPRYKDPLVYAGAVEPGERPLRGLPGRPRRTDEG